MLVQRWDRFDRVNLSRETGENRRLVARASADFQYTLVSLKPRCFTHQCDNVRLGNRLCRADRKWTIVIRMLGVFGRNKSIAFHPTHRGQNPAVFDSAPFQLLDHHPFSGLV